CRVGAKPQMAHRASISSKKLPASPPAFTSRSLVCNEEFTARWPRRGLPPPASVGWQAEVVAHDVGGGVERGNGGVDLGRVVAERVRRRAGELLQGRGGGRLEGVDVGLDRCRPGYGGAPLVLG